MWAADASAGWHGGAEGLRWVRDRDHADEAIAFLSQRADRVRVMAFLEGGSCSIHGLVFGRLCRRPPSGRDGDSPSRAPFKLLLRRRGVLLGPTSSRPRCHASARSSGRRTPPSRGRLPRTLHRRWSHERHAAALAIDNDQCPAHCIAPPAQPATLSLATHKSCRDPLGRRPGGSYARPQVDQGAAPIWWQRGRLLSSE